MGPLMLDCCAERLLAEEKEKLAHPVTGGVILFSRNYYDKAQLNQLIKEIRDAANKPLLIAVDHEGGHVQRFREGFTAIPAMGKLTEIAPTFEQAIELAQACGSVFAYELKQHNIDFSFAPVLDINGVSEVIGDRAFAPDSSDVIALATGLITGLAQCAMPAIGKHFPGHGSVAPDSHVALPVDSREFEEILATDMVVFKTLIEAGLLDGVMPAHVIYSQVDDSPAGFSSTWLQTQLKQTLGFNGVVFSDDLSMHGASVAGGYPERAQAALDAGCDMVLACNNTQGAEAILDSLVHYVEQKKKAAKHTNNTNSALTNLYARPLPGHAHQAYKDGKALLQNYQIT
ncbi:beta-N-acetylhexosaminidase [Alteromonas profundi]|nr:beta-N-acetylhexosaminidase [Alteromonas profundi]